MSGRQLILRYKYVRCEALLDLRYRLKVVSKDKKYNANICIKP